MKFKKNNDVFKIDVQDKLKELTVCIAGMGGVGGFVAESLIRLGISNLILIDGDTFESTNINRQLNATIKTLNKNKAIVTSERLLEINPDCNIKVIPSMLTISNIPVCDCFIDCMDNINNKYITDEVLKNNADCVIIGGCGNFGSLTTIFTKKDIIKPSDMYFYNEYPIVIDQQFETIVTTCMNLAANMASLFVNYYINSTYSGLIYFYNSLTFTSNIMTKECFVNQRRQIIKKGGV